MPLVEREIAACEAEFNGAGRILVRYSGTEALARVMVEGPGRALVEECANRIAAAIRREIGVE
jgi:phosphoglucosamine mutase